MDVFMSRMCIIALSGSKQLSRLKKNFFLKALKDRLKKKKKKNTKFPLYENRMKGFGVFLIFFF